MMVVLQNISYLHPDREPLFEDLQLTVARHTKAALIGNNGAGKSTLLRIIAGAPAPTAGQVLTDEAPYYVPQIFGQFNDLTVAQALRIHDKLDALHRILAGEVTGTTLALLNDDWTIEERCHEALGYWQLEGLALSQKMATLSGGQKPKVFLAGISIHQPGLILLDEPSNHLDAEGRQLFYHYIRASSATLMVVSHDRTLLNLADTFCELGKRGITAYGGNYGFYREQKELESHALNEELKSWEKSLSKVRETERESMERQQKLDARGKRKQEKAGVPTIMMNTLRNNAEKSTSRLKGVHAENVGALSDELTELRKALPDLGKMKFNFDVSALHKGKMLIGAEGINFTFGDRPLWKQPLYFQVCSSDRIALRGPNGSGKTTLIRIMRGEAVPVSGTVMRAENSSVYIDQEYSLIDPSLKVYEQAQRFNVTALQEHEVKIRLSRFLFMKDDWHKPCSALSGGEQMRLILCCLTISNRAPDMIFLDEPTNNLDLLNIEILTGAISDYQGTLIVVSHDKTFLDQVGIEKTIELH